MQPLRFDRAQIARHQQLDDARQRSAALIPAWRGAVARAIRRNKVSQPAAFSDAARDLGLERLDRGIPSSRRSLDRLMDQAYSVYQARQWRRKTRNWVVCRVDVDAFMRP